MEPKRLYIIQDDEGVKYQSSDGTSYTDIIGMCALVQQYAFHDLQAAIATAKAAAAQAEAARLAEAAKAAA